MLIFNSGAYTRNYVTGKTVGPFQLLETPWQQYDIVIKESDQIRGDPTKSEITLPSQPLETTLDPKIEKTFGKLLEVGTVLQRVLCFVVRTGIDDDELLRLGSLRRERVEKTA
jgi:hypothetical protein